MPRRLGQAARLGQADRPRQLPGLGATVVCAAVALLTIVTSGPAIGQQPPDEFQVPFACGEQWEGATRPTHSPSSLAVDWTQDSSELGHIVLASSPGVVESVVDLGDSSYGLHVVIDHGGGWTTLHAHLSSTYVVRGQPVDQGQVIGLVGSSGNSSSPHLHYEQRLNRSDQQVQFDGTAFIYNSWIESRNCADVPVVGDWNGDRVSDVGTFSRRASGSVFRKRLPGGSVRKAPWGKTTDQPLVGDWNGDGQFEPGVWRPTTQRFVLSTSRPKPRRIRFGESRETPLVGDWDGDGRWDVGTFDAASAMFSLRASNGSMSTKSFGATSSLPLAGDWDGDGRWTVGTFDPVTATFSLDLGGGATKTIRFGTRTSLPVVGNWNTDAVSDVGVWDTTTGVFSERLGPRRTRTVRFGHIR